MKIAYVVGAFPSPSETFIAREIAALERLGNEVHVFPLWRHPRAREADEASFRITRFGRWALGPAMRRSLAALMWKMRFLGSVGSEGLGAIRAIWRLAQAFSIAEAARERGIERVHAQFGNLVSTVGWVAAAEAGVPFSFAVHARDVFVEAQYLREKARAADHIIACNSAAADRTRERIDEADRPKAVLIHHGISLDEFPFREELPETATPLVIAVGRLVEKKGFGHLVRAAARLRDGGVPFSCWLVGDGPQRDALRREVEALGLADRVQLLGWMTPGELKMTAYEQASLLVVPSVVARDGDRDGLPNVVLEAAAMGLPIVATTTGGLGDLVRDGETALVAKPGDPDDLAATIAAALEDPEAAMERARRARAEVEARFGLERQAAKLVEQLRPQASIPG